MDAHISGRRIGNPLRDAGHDVKAADSHELEGAEDPVLFEMAALEGRVFVTSNVRDFEPLARQWTANGRTHAGLIMLSPSVRHEQFGRIIRGLKGLLATMSQEEWRNQVRWLG